MIFPSVLTQALDAFEEELVHQLHPLAVAEALAPPETLAWISVGEWHPSPASPCTTQVEGSQDLMIEIEKHYGKCERLTKVPFRLTGVPNPPTSAPPECQDLP